MCTAKATTEAVQSDQGYCNFTEPKTTTKNNQKAIKNNCKKKIKKFPAKHLFSTMYAKIHSCKHLDSLIS